MKNLKPPKKWGHETADSQDQETRNRLLDTAVQFFAERGFKRVTVREICNASGANVAAVNYHFGDKLGLYNEVVQTAIEAMQSTSRAVIAAGEGGSAEEKLRAHIRVYLQHLLDEGKSSWIHKLMNHEMADPTPALNLVFAQAIRPRLEYLSGIVGELLGVPPSDERVLLCVASIQGQCLIYVRNVIRNLVMPNWRPTPTEVDKIAGHIAQFSLGGVRAIARKNRKPGT
jgi:AcrR family transcriptional regulator